MTRKAFFITSFAFPRYDAGATRITMLAKALCDRGYEVELCGMGDDVDFDGIVCHTLNPYRSNRIFNSIAWRLVGVTTVAYAKSIIDDADVIVASFLPSSAVDKIKKLCRDAGVIFAVDCTEWFTPEEFPHGVSDPGYIDHMKLLTETIDSEVRVIAISRYLEHFFISKGCSVLRVPSVLDHEELAPDRSSTPQSSVISVMYAGSPAVKDSLGVVLDSICLLDHDVLEKMSFSFYGVTEDDLLHYIKNGTSLPGCVRAYGRVPREEVIYALKNADYTVLMRDPSMKFAQAGMPTKVTESLGCGTPVISNITSDLGDYLIDGLNSIVVSGYSAEACACALKRAASLGMADRLSMQREALKSMRSGLDYRAYSAALDEFLCGGEA